MENEEAGLMTFGDGEDMETVLNQLIEGGDNNHINNGNVEEEDGSLLAAQLDLGTEAAFEMPEGEELEQVVFGEQDEDQERLERQDQEQAEDDADDLGDFDERENEDGEQEEQSLQAPDDDVAEEEQQMNREGVAGGEEDMELIKPEDEADQEEKVDIRNNEEGQEGEESSRPTEEGGEGGEPTQQQEEGEEGDETSKQQEAEDEDEGESAEPKEEVPKVRKWTKKWVSVGHLKVYKWVPLDGKLPKRPVRTIMLQQNTGKISAKEQKALARTQRLMNDNAPITRSVTAAFKEKHQREMEQRAKRDRQKSSEAIQTPSRATRSSNRLRGKENKEIFSKISEDNIITPHRLTQEVHGGRVSGRKRKARSDDVDVVDTDGDSNSALELTGAEQPAGASSNTGLITNDVPLALPVPVSLSFDASGTKERRLY